MKKDGDYLHEAWDYNVKVAGEEEVDGWGIEHKT